MTSNKKITHTLTLKEIEGLASICPVITRLTNERHWVDGAELIAQGHTENGGQKVIAGRKYEQRFPVIIAINHKRNMKKIFKTMGDQGVLAYVEEAKKHEIINNELTSQDSRS